MRSNGCNRFNCFLYFYTGSVCYEKKFREDIKIYGLLLLICLNHPLRNEKFIQKSTMVRLCDIFVQSVHELKQKYFLSLKTLTVEPSFICFCSYLFRPWNSENILHGKYNGKCHKYFSFLIK